MQIVELGKTGLRVSRLGLGLAEIGSELGTEGAAQAAEVLNRGLDGGINFLDTSACYSVSEELIGQAVSTRRDEYVLATKAGHITGGYDGTAWTYQTVADSVDRSLERLRTDHLDLVQLHSCGIDVLEDGAVIRALQDAQMAGKVRHVGYSGDNEDAHWAVDSGLFASLQTSFNLVEQGARASGLLKRADERGMGIIIKRPIGGGTWGKARAGDTGSANRGYDQEYLSRSRELAGLGPIDGEPEDSIALALGFTLSYPEVDVAIAGTKNPRHLSSNLEIVESGLAIEQRVIDELKARWDRLGGAWRQLN